MKSSILKSALAAAFIAAFTAALGGCYALGPFDAINGEGFGGYYTGTDSRESVSEGYFKLTIHTPKDEFAKGEAVDCYAELEYIGDGDSITVYVYSDPVTMEMSGKNVYYTSSGNYYPAQKELTMKKGAPLRYTLSEVLPKSKSVLPGHYQIDAYASVSLSPDGTVTYYSNVSAVIVVNE
jgi:hypothetical protein